MPLAVATIIFVLAGCSIPTTGENPENQGILFRDGQQLFEAVLPAGAKEHSFHGKDYDYYVYEWWEADQPITRLEFRVLNSGFSGLMQPDYESTFQKECGCVVNQKGWVLVAGQKAREFQFTVDDGKRVAIERHFQWKDRMIQMQILAPISRQDAMRLRFQAILSTLKLL